MDKPGYVSLDKSGLNKKGGARTAMPGFEGLQAYANTDQDSYEQDDLPPANLQDNPDIKHSVNVPYRYY
jgi:hypothetical protein